MAKVDIPITVEMEFTAGVWTSVNSYLPLSGGLRWRRGVGVDHTLEASTCSFTLDNSDETWTPGNRSSARFNQLKKGVGVRVKSVYSAVTKYHFRGIVMSFAPTFPDASWTGMGMEVECEGLVSLLRAYSTYNMALQSSQDVDDVMTAIMVACGVDAALYSFEDSGFIIPIAYPRSDALTDLLDVARSELFGLVFEDGDGRLRLKAAASMRGGHATPTHTWGITVAPEGDVVPEYRHDTQFGRVNVSASVLKTSEEYGVLYEHTPNATTSLPEKLDAGAEKRIKFRSEQMPVTYTKTFTNAVGSYWTDTGDDLGGAAAPNGAMNATQTTLKSYSPSTAAAYLVGSRPVAWASELAPGMYIRVDNEVMFVTSMVSTSGAYDQTVNVLRAQLGTVAVTHAANTSIFARTYTAVDVFAHNTVGTNDASSGSPPPNSYDQFEVYAINTDLVMGDLLVNTVNAEMVMVRSTPIPDPTLSTPPRFIFDVVRGARDTTVVLQTAKSWYRRSYVYDTEEGDANLLYSADNSTGLPADPVDIRGKNSFTGLTAVLMSGRDGVVDIQNNAASARWLSKLTVKGNYVVVSEQSMEATFELPIPGITGIPDGPSVSMPFGLADLRAVEGYAIALLGAGRYPSPWLTVAFTANMDTNTSILNSEIGDLVLYTGMGTRRETINEYFRIMSIEGVVNEYSETVIRFVLAPSYLWRNAIATWYSEFAQQAGSGVTGLGAFEVDSLAGVPAGWNGTDGQFDNNQVVGATPALALTYGNMPGVAASVAQISVSSATQIVAAKWEVVSTSQNSWPAASAKGGFGVCFRGDGTPGGPQWMALIRPGTGVYLWNNSVGMFGSAYPYTITNSSAPEIEVRAFGNRIRVYVDCNPEPVIDVISSYLNTQQYAGIALDRTIVSGGGVNPRVRWFMASGA